MYDNYIFTGHRYLYKERSLWVSRLYLLHFFHEIKKAIWKNPKSLKMDLGFESHQEKI